MSPSLKSTVGRVVEQSLDEADAIWGELGPSMKMALASEGVENRSLPSRIPGHAVVVDGKPKVDEFIAIAVDLRNSTDHLLNLRSGIPPVVMQEQRVFYETSALLPACSYLIDHRKGKTTEYPGDGVLGLFNARVMGKDESIYAEFGAAEDCIQACVEIINPILRDRYSLPPLVIGVGMGLSRAIVTAVGHDGFRQPRAVGKCVYFATKLSHGNNQIYVDSALRYSWPTVETGGVLSFQESKVGKAQVEGFLVTRK